MSRSSVPGAVCYEVESAFGENVSTFSTARLPVQTAVDASGLTQAMIQCGTVYQHLQAGGEPIVGIKGGSFKTKFYLPGHGSTTSGAMTATDIPTLLGYVLGGSSLGPTGTTATAASTTTSINTTASGTFTKGQFFRAGTGVVGNTASDTRGSGQFNIVTAHNTTILTPKFATPGALNAADVIYSAETVYTAELPASSSMTSVRFLIQTFNMEYEAHGCYAKSVTFAGIGVDGSLPTVEIDWGVAWFTYSTAAFPSAVTMNDFTPAPSGGANSVFLLMPFGSTSRSTRTIRNFSVTCNLNTMAQMGPGGVDQFQVVTSAVRGPAKISVSWEEDAPAATLTPQTETDWTNTTAKHAMLQLSGSPGSAMAFYWPKMWPQGNKPVQINSNGINRHKYTYECQADTQAGNSTDLTCSAMRIGFA